MQKYLFILIFQCSLHIVFAQIDTTTSIQTEINNDAINLVRDIFISGTCNNVSNIESTGIEESFGEFHNGEEVINFTDGIILSTGDVGSARGPNTCLLYTSPSPRD